MERANRHRDETTEFLRAYRETRFETSDESDFLAGVRTGIKNRRSRRAHWALAGNAAATLCLGLFIWLSPGLQTQTTLNDDSSWRTLWGNLEGKSTTTNLAVEAEEAGVNPDTLAYLLLDEEMAEMLISWDEVENEDPVDRLVQLDDNELESFINMLRTTDLMQISEG